MLGKAQEMFAGHLMPHFYTFKGKRIRANHIMGCEQGASMAVQEEAWMTKNLFKQWINNHFTRNVPGGVSLDNPHLLILDGHGSRVDIEVIEATKSIGLHLFVLPPHTSHKLQPLDVSCYSPFKTAFKRMRGKYMLVNKKVEPRKEDLASMIREAIRDALTPQNIKSGFKATGIHPFNKLDVQANRDVIVAANGIASNNDCATTSNADVTNAINLSTSDPIEDHVDVATCNNSVPPSHDLSNANNLSTVGLPGLPEATIDANANNLSTSHMAQQAHNIVVNIASPMSSLAGPVNNSFPLTITFIINGFSAAAGASNIDLVPSTSRDARLQSQPSQLAPSISGDVQLQPQHAQHPQQSQPSQLGPSIFGDVQLQPQDTQHTTKRRKIPVVNLTGLVTCDEFVAAADKARARKLEVEKVKLQKAEERRKESERKKAAKEALQKEDMKRKEEREAKRRATQLGKQIAATSKVGTAQRTPLPRVPHDLVHNSSLSEHTNNSGHYVLVDANRGTPPTRHIPSRVGDQIWSRHLFQANPTDPIGDPIGLTDMDSHAWVKYDSITTRQGKENNA